MTSSNNNQDFYNLEGEELSFFQRLTNIKDEDQLRAHIVDIQRKASESIIAYADLPSLSKECPKQKIVTPQYLCRSARLKMAHLPGYKEAFKVLKSQNQPILLDIGCCFGNDTRKAVIDGWPIDRVVASDLRQEFWNYGHELFKSTPQTFPVKFIPGDVFNPSILAPRGPFLTGGEISDIMSSPAPALSDLTSLTPLQGKLSVIHASAFFHLFSEDEQRTLARLLSSLLRPEKGSVIFGQHGAKPQKGFRKRTRGPSTGANSMFCHSPESWKELWVIDVFRGRDGRECEHIKVDTELVQVERKDLLGGSESGEDTTFYVMNWCITRL